MSKNVKKKRNDSNRDNQQISRSKYLSHKAIAFRTVLANEGARRLNNRNLPKRRPKGDPPKIFDIIQCGPVIEVVHADLAYVDFSDGVKRTERQLRSASRSHRAPPQRETMEESCGRIHTAVACLPRIISVHRGALRRNDVLLVRVGGKEESEFKTDAQGLLLWERMRMEVDVALTPSTQPKECGVGRGSDLKAVIVQGVSDTVEVGAPVGLPIVDQHLGDVVIECYDVTARVTRWRKRISCRISWLSRCRSTIPCVHSGSVFSFTPVNIAPFGDHSEHFCCRVTGDVPVGQGRPDSLGYGDPTKSSGFSVSEQSLRANGSPVEQRKWGSIGEFQRHIWREEGREDGKGTTASAAMMVKGKRIRISIRDIWRCFTSAANASQLSLSLQPRSIRVTVTTNCKNSELPNGLFLAWHRQRICPSLYHRPAKSKPDALPWSWGVGSFPDHVLGGEEQPATTTVMWAISGGLDCVHANAVATSKTLYSFLQMDVLMHPRVT
ncbi:hypothetical protein EDD85DRAFT_791005 [Armillaria nabsnona]|nr:hypothetical protein EDD85DRAFT_791005 [Armillaria nabsnona]